MSPMAGEYMSHEIANSVAGIDLVNDIVKGDSAVSAFACLSSITQIHYNGWISWYVYRWAYLCKIRQ